MQSTLRQNHNPMTTSTDPSTADGELRQPQEDPGRRLAETLRDIGEDARGRAESYPHETLVPEGGE